MTRHLLGFHAIERTNCLADQDKGAATELVDGTHNNGISAERGR